MNTNDPSTPGRIVVGVDGSESSKHALRWARFMADAVGAQIEAVAVCELAFASAGAGRFEVPATQNQLEEATAMLGQTLNDVFGADQPYGLRPTIEQGDASTALLKVSKGAQTLVVGSRGHGGFAGLMMGSVSSKCASHADVPVLVTHGDSPTPPALPQR